MYIESHFIVGDYSLDSVLSVSPPVYPRGCDSPLLAGSLTGLYFRLFFHSVAFRSSSCVNPTFALISSPEIPPSLTGVQVLSILPICLDCCPEVLCVPEYNNVTGHLLVVYTPYGEFGGSVVGSVVGLSHVAGLESPMFSSGPFVLTCCCAFCFLEAASVRLSFASALS